MKLLYLFIFLALSAQLSFAQTVLKEITGREMISLHTDISTKSGERVIIFVLDEKLAD